MSVTLIATPGAANANSYASEAEATAYFAARLPLKTPWDDVEDRTAALAMAARTLDAMFRSRRVLKRDGDYYYYVTYRQWTGTPATTVQKLAWPRNGMLDQNGNAIANTVIPQELKDAQCELAGQLAVSDTTIESDASAQGLTDLKVGDVSLSFKDSIPMRVVPDAAINLLVPSWFVEETIEPVTDLAQFDVI